MLGADGICQRVPVLFEAPHRLLDAMLGFRADFRRQFECQNLRREGFDLKNIESEYL